MLSTLSSASGSGTPTIGKSPLILCYYTNVSNQLQILRVNSMASQDLCQPPQLLEKDSPIAPEVLKFSTATQGLCQKVIFPGQRILFQALPGAMLNIYLGSSEGEKFIDQIQCQHLRVSQGHDY